MVLTENGWRYYYVFSTASVIYTLWSESTPFPTKAISGVSQTTGTKRYMYLFSTAGPINARGSRTTFPITKTTASVGHAVRALFQRDKVTTACPSKACISSFALCALDARRASEKWGTAWNIDTLFTASSIETVVTFWTPIILYTKWACWHAPRACRSQISATVPTEAAVPRLTFKV